MRLRFFPLLLALLGAASAGSAPNAAPKAPPGAPKPAIAARTPQAAATPLRLYFLRGELLLTSGHPPHYWQDLGLTGLVVPLVGVDLFRERVSADQLRAVLRPLRAAAGKTPLWLSIPSTYRLLDSEDRRRTFPPVEQPALWEPYRANLRQLSALTAELGIVAVVLDAELYASAAQTKGHAFGAQPPKWAWPGGNPQAWTLRAQEWVSALCSGNPGLLLGQHVIYSSERPLGAYRHFWRAAYKAIGPGAVCLSLERSRDHRLQHPAFTAYLRKEFAAPGLRVIHGWTLRESDSGPYIRDHYAGAWKRAVASGGLWFFDVAYTKRAGAACAWTAGMPESAVSELRRVVKSL